MYSEELAFCEFEIQIESVKYPISLHVLRKMRPPLTSMGFQWCLSRLPWEGAHSCLRGHIWLVAYALLSWIRQMSWLQAFCWCKILTLPPENFRIWLKGSNVPPSNNDFESNVPHMFLLDLRTFVVKSALSRLRAFWGALLAKILWEGAHKHLKGPGLPDQMTSC